MPFSGATLLAEVALGTVERPMPENASRRLAAILAADIAGYSALMGSDEARTVQDLKGHQAVVLPMIREFGGRIIDTAGDGILAEFPSVVNAMKCAVAIQSKMAERNTTREPDRRMQFRIGINIGDVMYDENRIYGDGINVAARLEGIAEAGGICVSGKVYDEISGRIDLGFQDIGEQQLKNITRPVRAYKARLESAASLAVAAAESAVSEKPSIAVLPFQNMSGDPEQEYFADGMVDEIITSLSRIQWLIVTSRTSTFAFKGQNADIRDIARKLSVRYVLEGSVRKAGNRVRIIGQLIDAASGAHIWAERLDGKLDDIFDLQDRITECVVGAIEPKLQHAEIERAKRKRPESMDAYDYYLRALPSSHRPTPDNSVEALRLLEEGFAIDPNYPPANAVAAWLYFYRVAATWSTSPQEDRARAVRLARVAVDYGEGDPFVLAMGGFLLASMGKDVETGMSVVNRAVVMSPNSAVVLQQAGWTSTFTGDQDRAVACFKAAIRLSPSDPMTYRRLTGAAAASVLAGRFADAVAFGEEARHHYEGWGPTYRFLAAAHAQLGETAKAIEALAKLFKLEPAVTVSHLRSFLPYQNQEQAERLWGGLRKAGMPE
jgi:TolB-like protein/Tfp pilus assembly protein PilF